MTHEVLEPDKTNSSVETTTERKKPFHPSYKTMLAEEKLKTKIWKVSCYCMAGVALIGWALLILEKF